MDHVEGNLLARSSFEVSRETRDTLVECLRRDSEPCAASSSAWSEAAASAAGRCTSETAGRGYDNNFLRPTPLNQSSVCE
jgi:hypothetical protein